jgi:acyl-CoA synthetase (AMP-forming)/AMP-acid ligase II/acyl carrier protein
VLLLLDNGVEHLVGLFAVFQLGATAVPLSPDTRRHRLDDVVLDTDASVCLAASAVAHPSIRRVGLDFTTLTMDPVPVGDGRLSHHIDVGAPALIRYSSGSTGRPKGVVLTHRQLLWTAQLLATAYGLDTQHREIVIAPMVYSGAWQRVAATLLGGGCVLFSQASLSPASILEDVAETHATGFFAPPPLVRTLLRMAPARVNAALRSCRSIEFGSGPLSADELQSASRLLPDSKIFFHYGLTECSRATILDLKTDAGKLHTVGRAAPGVEISIRATDASELPAGSPGEIFLRGPQRADCYWKRPQLDASRFVDRWLATGDYGVLDKDGFLTVVGRRDDMINSGGQSFFPAEVEAELGPVEGLRQWIVAGVSDPRGVLGQVPWAFVVPVTPADWSPEEFLATARKRLPAHMVPRWVVVVPGLPLTPSGKLDRRSAVERYGPESGTLPLPKAVEPVAGVTNANRGETQREHILDTLLSRLGERRVGGPGPLSASSELSETLLLDSLAVLEIVFVVEQEFGISLKRGDLDHFDTPSNIADLIARKLSDDQA